MRENKGDREMRERERRIEREGWRDEEEEE